MTRDTILVTGAGGFVGGRLAQRLALQHPATVRPLVHRISGPGSMRLARLPVDIEEGSVLEAERVREVIDGCDAVVHCAVGTRETIVDGTQTLLDAADDAGVDRFVHMSSASVHGHSVEGIVREESPYDPETAYARAKVDAEKVIEEYRHELAPTVLRPYIIYGPHSEFVREPIAFLRDGAVLADGGAGPLNQVYVDNLVDAILLALSDAAAPGEAFLVRDDDQVSWRTYFEAVAAMMDGAPPIREESRRRIRLRNVVRSITDNVTPPINVLKSVLGSDDVRRAALKEARRMPIARGTFARLPEPAKRRVRSAFVASNGGVLPQEATEEERSEAQYPLPSERYAAMQASRGRISNRKIKEVLGWRQDVSFEEAMRLIHAWAAWEDLVEKPPPQLA